jgi:hypothetical protein
MKFYITDAGDGIMFIRCAGTDGIGWSMQLNQDGSVWSLNTQSIVDASVGVDGSGWITRELQPVELPVGAAA